MTPLLLATAIGAATTLAVWALRDDLRRRFEHDVAWLEYMVWRFTPDPVDARRYVAGFYLVAVLLLFAMLLALPNPLVAIGIWVALIVAPRVVLAHLWSRRRKTIDEQLPVAVRQMASSVGAGMSLAQAIERLGERAPAPIRVEFRIMANYWNLGSDFTSTIEEAKRRLGLRNFNLFASALVVNQRMGGNITETLNRLAGSLEAIEQMRQDVHAATAEGRTNIKVLAVAPAIMLGLVSLMDGEAVGMLFTKSMGHALLALAGTLTVVGTAWAWKVVAADV